MPTHELILILTAAFMALLAIGLLFRLAKLSHLVTDYKKQLEYKDTLMLEREQQFVEQLEIRIKQARKHSNNTQRSVLKGQIGEQFTPFIADFPYNPADCRFMGDPIDYMIFQNLHECSEGSAPIESVQIIIAEVKTGHARLNKRQKILRQAIENGQVSFRELRIKEIEGLESPRFSVVSS